MPWNTMGMVQEVAPMIWKREPVLILAVVQAAITLVVSFGLDLTGQQVGSIVAFTAAVLGFVARSQVTPLVPPPPPPPLMKE